MYFNIIFFLQNIFRNKKNAIRGLKVSVISFLELPRIVAGLKHVKLEPVTGVHPLVTLTIPSQVQKVC
jgi:hypothetical protein